MLNESMDESVDKEERVSKDSLLNLAPDGPTTGRQRSGSLDSDDGLLERHSAGYEKSRRVAKSKETF